MINDAKICPRCRSDWILKTGFEGDTTRGTWRCNNCGAEWVMVN